MELIESNINYKFHELYFDPYIDEIMRKHPYVSGYLTFKTYTLDTSILDKEEIYDTGKEKFKIKYVDYRPTTIRDKNSKDLFFGVTAIILGIVE